jgi:hypothetical protein
LNLFLYYELQYIITNKTSIPMDFIYLIGTLLSIIERKLHNNITNFKVNEETFPDLEPGLYYGNNFSDDCRINIKNTTCKECKWVDV